MRTVRRALGTALPLAVAVLAPALSGCDVYEPPPAEKQRVNLEMRVVQAPTDYCAPVWIIHVENYGLESATGVKVYASGCGLNVGPDTAVSIEPGQGTNIRLAFQVEGCNPANPCTDYYLSLTYDMPGPPNP